MFHDLETFTIYGLSINAAYFNWATYGTNACSGSWVFFLKNVLLDICISIVIWSNLADRYMAPEVYRRESYGKHVDVFSFALVVYEVCQIKLKWKLVILLLGPCGVKMVLLEIQ